MPKRSDFPIRKVEGRAKPWLLDVPPRYSETGKRERRFYATKRQAETERRRTKELREAHGASVRSLKPSIIDEAAKASRILKPTGATLSEAARHFLGWWQQQQASKSFAEAWQEVQDAKASHLAERTLERTRQVGNKMLPLLGDKLLSEITTRDLEDVLSEVSTTDTSKMSFIQKLSPVFRHGARLLPE
jgi:hypothetical protein